MPLSEIWLRMAAVKWVNGAWVREYLTKTAESTPLDPQALLNAVLTSRQHQRYRRCSPSELEMRAAGWRNRVTICLLSTMHVIPAAGALYRRGSCLYGKQCGDYFASQFTAAGLTITSGLALGIDGVCHYCAALAAGEKTVAVLGCGIGYGYPRQHRRLVAEIVA